jgi:hypothetical protein
LADFLLKCHRSQEIVYSPLNICVYQLRVRRLYWLGPRCLCVGPQMARTETEYDQSREAEKRVAAEAVCGRHGEVPCVLRLQSIAAVGSQAPRDRRSGSEVNQRLGWDIRVGCHSEQADLLSTIHGIEGKLGTFRSRD